MKLNTARLGSAAIAVWMTLGIATLVHGAGFDEMYDDAELTSVCFVDVDHGWAVGDRGVIWRTDDGGRNWHRQQSPTNARLESIHFVDHDNGWIVGGFTHPYTHRTTGVVLRSRDGGRSWQQVRGLSMPLLRKVHMVDVKQGWAVGASSKLHPSGVFKTKDGGRSWASLPSAGSAHWITGDFRSMKQGVLVGRDATIAAVRGMNVHQADLPDLGLRHIHQVRMLGSSGGWLVGDQGLILQRSDVDGKWILPAGRLPNSVDQIDLMALACIGPHCWIAGNPGTRVFYSADYGQSWTVFETEIAAPIRSLFFVNEKYGWAVGSLGTIQATRDGGQTWVTQRAGGKRAGILTLTGDASQLPLPMFAQVCGNFGYLGIVEVIGRRDLDSPRIEENSLNHRVHESVTMVGGSGAYQSHRFPLRERGIKSSPESIIKQWGLLSDESGQAALDEYLVRRIRQWRPAVIITDDRAGSGIAQIIHSATLRAVTAAGDATAYPQHAALGLRPWTVSKVFASLPPDRRGTVVIQTQTLAPRLGRSIGDIALLGQGMLHEQHQTIPDGLPFQMLVNQTPHELGRRDIMSGVSLPHGGEARRRISSAASVNTSALVHAMQKRRNMEQLIARSDRTGGGASWVGQMQDLVKGMPKDFAVQVLYQLAQKFHESGQQPLAASVMEQIVREHPSHALAEPCMIWLVQYYSSGELFWRQRRKTKAATQLGVATAETTGGGLTAAGGLPNVRTPPMPVIQASANAKTARGGMKQSDRDGFTLSLAKTIERTRPELFFEPSLRFPLAVSQKRLGFGRKAEQYVHRVAGLRQLPGWWQCAQTEIWLSHGQHIPPKTVANCQVRDKAPFLDGRLNEEVWKTLPLISMESSYRDDDQWPAVGLMYHDREYLYLAISCRKAPGTRYEPSPTKRARDQKMDKSDRVEIYIDIDRDYSSYYRLSFDYRGNVSDACFGDSSWNPKLFVASKQEAHQWVVEIAIPFNQLADHTPTAQDVWAVGFQRVVPGTGFQSWTKPASVRPVPEGFGLMTFQ